MAYKGIYKPSNHKKYLGNPSNIIYRSLWERKFMVYCDQSAHILEWASEEISIPYISPIDRRRHKYYPDFYIKYKDKNAKIVREIIEVKPKKYLSPPKEPKRRTKRYITEVSNYIINQAKFEAAENFCNERKLSFRILTEEHLVPKK